MLPRPVDTSDEVAQRDRIVFCADPFIVRSVLLTATTVWGDWGLSAETRGDAELVLGEVLNNIVEHAYAGSIEGEVRLHFAYEGSRLEFDIYDDGVSMPDGALPLRDEIVIGDELETLPEGGFGWFMIGNMTEDLRYQRRDAQNHLHFAVPTGD